jgi:hypothetical protein
MKPATEKGTSPDRQSALVTAWGRQSGNRAASASITQIDGRLIALPSGHRGQYRRRRVLDKTHPAIGEEEVAAGRMQAPEMELAGRIVELAGAVGVWDSRIDGKIRTSRLSNVGLSRAALDC